MSCDNCDKALPIHYCATSLEVGTLTADTDYKAEFTNVATGRTDIVEGTSDVDGLLTLDITDLQPPYDLTFELRITDTDGEPVSFTIGSTEYCCVQFKFVKHETPLNKISFTVCSTT